MGADADLNSQLKRATHGAAGRWTIYFGESSKAYEQLIGRVAAIGEKWETMSKMEGYG